MPGAGKSDPDGKATDPSAPLSPEKSPTGKPPKDRSGLLEQLRNIPGIVLARELEQVIEEREQARGEFLQSLGLELIETPKGCFWRRDRDFSLPLTVQPQAVPSAARRDIREIAGEELARLGDDDALSKVQPEQLLYLDTETTSLSGGAGVIAFLVGVGWLESDRFVVRQYFMRDFDEEPAMLADLLELMQRFTGFVTYNGKCFDIPLLQVRYVMQRSRIALQSWPHLDLLHPARKLWKARCGSCSLGNLEKAILGMGERECDIPGEEIPAVYFDFVRGRRIERMRPVLEHNVQDIVSLAVLNEAAAYTVANPERCDVLDRYSVARWRERLGLWDESVRLFEDALAVELPEGLPLGARFIALRTLGLMHRRARAYDSASEAWKRLCADPFPPHPMAWIELAKYNEHIVKRFEEALGCVEQAEESLRLNVKLARNSEFDEENWPEVARLTEAAARRFREDLEKRRTRLEKRLEKAKADSPSPCS